MAPILAGTTFNSSDLFSKLQTKIAYLSPLECSIEISNSACQKLNSLFLAVRMDNKEVAWPLQLRARQVGNSGRTWSWQRIKNCGELHWDTEVPVVTAAITLYVAFKVQT